MKIERVILRQIHLPYLHPIQTSHFRHEASSAIIVQIDSDGATGWGEAPFLPAPWYNAEAVSSGWVVMTEFLVPVMVGQDIQHPSNVHRLWQSFVGNMIARSGIEFALWDLYGKCMGQSIAQLLGGTRQRVEVGVSLGIADDTNQLLATIAAYREKGYRRIKLKIRPGHDVETVAAVRERYPDIPLQVDANSIYTLTDIPHLQTLDQYDLMLIEQPFDDDDIIDHARLQAVMKTPVCLDESITSLAKARKAIDLDAARIINIKPARVGGLTPAQAIHDLASEHDVPVWCGGMMETGIGRATNVQLASLSGFRLPADLSENAHYFDRDIVENPFALNADSTITIPASPGNGAMVDLDYLEAVTIRCVEVTAS